ncbi:MAG: carbohydrate-binding protein [Bacteroidota bacterium]
MMESAGVAGTQHEFRAKLISTIGETLTDSFYTVWLENHFTRTDVDSMASWGFNSVRVAMHYKWFTLPIEEEPVPGEQTWLPRGFEMIDSLLDWCGDNGMYLILDLHGAPGGQGKNADISDYDPTKLSLWESQDNKDKTVALWKKLAQRYSNEPWIGAYDLINETNWTFPEGNNSQMRTLFIRITDSIRVVDPNHLIIIEGNSFANDFSGLLPAWDPNMAYSFHKYWTYNHANSLEWVTKNVRDKYNVPIWLGESGENSNTWFTNLISLSESQNIGWSWWPVKKGGINNPLKVEVNADYLRLIDNWKGSGPVLSQEEAFQAVMTFARNHRIGNCHFQRDVVDAMMRQPHTTETQPFVPRSVDDVVFASDYNLGRNGYAYFDQDTADYHGENGVDFTAWNAGWTYRSDGVDIESCTDALTNGYSVGWTNKGEWLTYTLTNGTAASYTLEVRSAAGGSGGQIHVEVNGVDATGTVALPATGGWYTWKTSDIEHVILPEGQVDIRIVFDQAGSNLNFIRFTNPQPDSLLPFEFASAKTEVLDNVVYVSLNKPVTSAASFEISDFTLTQDGSAEVIENVTLSGVDPRILVITLTGPLFYNKSLRVSYTGQEIMHQDQQLSTFQSETVNNLLARHFTVPSRVQAELFYRNNGLVLEDCSDAGGGQNTGYANVGDYLDYVLNVPEAGEYSLDFRVATGYAGAKLSLRVDRGDGFQSIGTMNFSNTGGWQTWTTQSTKVSLEAGKYLFRLLVTGNEHNLNWFEFNKVPVSLEKQRVTDSFDLYPNPATGHTTIRIRSTVSEPAELEVLDGMGRVVYRSRINGQKLDIDTSAWVESLYFVRLSRGGKTEVRKLIVKN